METETCTICKRELSAINGDYNRYGDFICAGCSPLNDKAEEVKNGNSRGEGGQQNPFDV